MHADIAAALLLEISTERDGHGAGSQARDEGPDVFLQVLRVHPVRGAPDVKRLEVAVEQLVRARVRPRVALLVDLAGEPAKRLVRLGRRLRASGDNLAEVVAPAGQRVDACVDRDA